MVLNNKIQGGDIVNQVSDVEAKNILSVLDKLLIKTKLAGVTFGSRQHYIKKYARNSQKWWLIREPDNKFDPNAIRVCVSKWKADVGYIPKKLAQELAPVIDAGVDLKVGFHLKLFNENDLSKPMGLMIKIWV
jgi:hypothetical protein